MPIYEYRRPDGTTFELIQGFSDEPLTADPDTGVPVERVLHAPAVHFKGKGFYNTDYGTRKRQRETAGSGDGSAEKGSSDTAGSNDKAGAAAEKGSASSSSGSPEKGSSSGGSSEKGSSSGGSSEKGSSSSAKAEKVAASTG